MVTSAGEPQSKRLITACRDRRDDKFLELALNGNGDADAIVTGHQDLLELDPFRRIRITARAACLGM